MGLPVPFGRSERCGKHRCAALYTHTDCDSVMRGKSHVTGKVTESQNGRDWKGPLGSPSPTACPSRVTQSRLHSTASRRGLKISREGDSTASLGSLGQGSVTLRVKNHGIIGWKRPLRSSSPTIKKFFHQEVLPRVQLQLPLLQFVPIAPCRVAEHH